MISLEHIHLTAAHRGLLPEQLVLLVSKHSFGRPGRVDLADNLVRHVSEAHRIRLVSAGQSRKITRTSKRG